MTINNNKIDCGDIIESHYQDVIYIYIILDCNVTSTEDINMVRVFGANNTPDLEPFLGILEDDDKYFYYE